MASKSERTFRVGGKIAARLIGNEVVKYVQGSKHFLHKPRAIAFDEQVVRDAEAVGAAAFRVGDIETGKVYWASMEQFLAGSFSIDRGFGKQIALPMGKWREAGFDESPGSTPGIAKEEKSEDGYSQLSLF